MAASTGVLLAGNHYHSTGSKVTLRSDITTRREAHSLLSWSMRDSIPYISASPPPLPTLLLYPRSDEDGLLWYWYEDGTGAMTRWPGHRD